MENRTPPETTIRLLRPERPPKRPKRAASVSGSAAARRPRPFRRRDSFAASTCRSLPGNLASHQDRIYFQQKFIWYGDEVASLRSGDKLWLYDYVQLFVRIFILTSCKVSVEKCLKIGMSHPSDNSDLISPFVLCFIHVHANVWLRV